MSPRVLSPAALILLAAFSVVGGTPSTARSQSFTLLVPPSPYTNSIVRGLSADGTKAVGAMAGPADPLHTPGLYWSIPDGGITAINEPGTSELTGSTAISGNGHVVVGSGANNTGPARAYRWSGPGTYQELSPSAGMYDSYASAVSGDGARTVGWMTTGPHTWDVTQAVYWDAAGTPTPIALLGSVASAISRDGNIIVGNQQVLPFVWTEDAGVQYLPTFPDPNERGSYVGAISGDGRYIVGQSVNVPVVWHDGTLTQFFGPGGATVYGGFSGVSDDRSVIIGSMKTPTFQTSPASGPPRPR